MENEGMRLRVSGPGAPWVAFSNSFPEFLRTSPFLRFPSLLPWKVGRCSAVTTPIPPAGWGGGGGGGGPLALPLPDSRFVPGVAWPCSAVLAWLGQLFLKFPIFFHLNFHSHFVGLLLQLIS